MTTPAAQPNPTQVQNGQKAQREWAAIWVSAIAIAASLVSLVLTIVFQNVNADQDRQATYNRDILVPAYTRFTTALDTLEQAEQADLALADLTSTSTTKYTTLLSAVRTAKAEVDLVAPAEVSDIAQQANDQYGTEQFCMDRLIGGKAGTNFAAEHANRLHHLGDLERLREHFVLKARSEVSNDSDPLKTTPSAMPKPSPTTTASTPRAGDC